MLLAAAIRIKGHRITRGGGFGGIALVTQTGAEPIKVLPTRMQSKP